MSDANPRSYHVEPLISGILRGGVLISSAIVVFGVLLTFFHNPQYFSARGALGSLIDSRHAYTSNVATVLEGVRGFRGQSFVMLGLLVLIATPVARVAASVLVFIAERDRLYVLMTSIVLILLIASFFLGAAG